MKTTDAYAELVQMNRPVLSRREVATRLKTSPTNAGRALRAMREAGLVTHLRRGLWGIDREIEPFAVVPYLTAPFPAYVSLFSALHRHGMIEQIPRQVSVVSLDRTREIQTTLGVYAVHHVAPELFGGYEGSENRGYLATPEKALFDLVYLRAAAGSRAYVPELTLPRDFDRAETKKWVARINSARLRTLVSRHLRQILARRRG